ncbi:hypothetical protein JR316_0007895 [Psilocybe cubensis]|uniref:Uncharacterized protein n=1 Tax=Psilocybe cubensis TaxID=181762 RepID=A0ACB8GVQ6_PSICU|nr:hypothetical protein JR316_0007895 [Psilocybe cubensis]KAH9479306.1 hypothetical protein JR316_0007895 [Psilocybe cubensis]
MHADHLASIQLLSSEALSEIFLKGLLAIDYELFADSLLRIITPRSTNLRVLEVSQMCRLNMDIIQGFKKLRRVKLEMENVRVAPRMRTDFVRELACLEELEELELYFILPKSPVPPIQERVQFRSLKTLRLYTTVVGLHHFLNSLEAEKLVDLDIFFTIAELDYSKYYPSDIVKTAALLQQSLSDINSISQVIRTIKMTCLDIAVMVSHTTLYHILRCKHLKLLSLPLDVDGRMLSSLFSRGEVWPAVEQLRFFPSLPLAPNASVLLASELHPFTVLFPNLKELWVPVSFNFLASNAIEPVEGTPSYHQLRKLHFQWISTESDDQDRRSEFGPSKALDTEEGAEEIEFLARRIAQSFPHVEKVSAIGLSPMTDVILCGQLQSMAH